MQLLKLIGIGLLIAILSMLTVVVTGVGIVALFHFGSWLFKIWPVD